MPQWLIDAIMKLWGECRNPEYIAAKLNLIDEVTGDFDTDKVLGVIEDPNNYPSKREYFRGVVVQQS